LAAAKKIYYNLDMVTLIIHCPLQFSIPSLRTVDDLYSCLLLVSRHNPYLVSMNIAVQSIMLSSKLLPEMEVEETLNREHLFFTQQERVTIVCHN
jgi:hypothetical protein